MADPNARIVETLRKRAMRAFQAGVAAADPFLALTKALDANPLPKPRGNGKRIVISVGKAAIGLMKAAQSVDDGIDTVRVVVTNYENKAEVADCEVLLAGHPTPDENGLAAATKIMHLAQNAGADDCVIMLVSGGASALLPAPHPDISLSDKIKVNDILLNNSFDIQETNLVRQNLSVLKGGGLSRMAAPASVTSYILSDVIGDDLRVVASGPTVGALGQRRDAVALLKDRAVFDQMPECVRTLLLTDEPAKPTIAARNILIGSNTVSAEAMSHDANADLDPHALVGDVEAAAEFIVNTVSERGTDTSYALAWGGETTVNVTGSGLGGRNQELALRVAALMQDHPTEGHWVFLSGATDGIDGPTDAAGGLVDAGTKQRIENTAGSLKGFLDANNSHCALKAAGDLIKIGATGTNVADLQLFIIIADEDARNN